MATEIELEEKMITYDDKFKETNMSSPSISRVSITNPMIDICNKDKHYGSNIYDYRSQWKLIFVLLIGILVIINGNMDKFKSESSDSFINKLSITFSIIMMLFSIITFTICYLKTVDVYRQAANVHLYKDKTDEEKANIKYNILFYEINRLFGIPVESYAYDDEDKIKVSTSIATTYSVDKRKFGLMLLLFILYASLSTLLVESIFPLKSTINCESSDILKSDTYIHSICVVNQSSVSFVYVFVLCLVIIGLSYSRIKNDFQTDIDNEHEKLVTKIENNEKILNIEDDIGDRMREWYDNKKNENRRAELIAIIICCILFHFFSYGIVRNKIFSGGINAGAILFCFYVYIGDAILLSTLLYVIQKQIFFYYSFPAIIMKQISYQIKSTHINDILLWWQTRKFYLHCVIEIYAAGMNGLILIGLFGSVITLIFFASSLSTADAVSIIFLWWAIIITLYAFAIVGQAVNFHETELSHYHTINKERLKLQINRYKGEKFNYSQEIEKKIFEIVLKDIKHNSNPIKIFGIKMNSDFLLFLRGAVVTIGIAAYFA